jgi:hypothetical protein
MRNDSFDTCIHKDNQFKGEQRWLEALKGVTIED